MLDIGYRGEPKRRQPNGARVLNRSHFAYPNLLAAIPLIGASEVVTGKPPLAAPSGIFPTYLGTSRGYGVTTAWTGWGYEVPFRRNASTAFTVLYLTHGGPANTYAGYLGILGSPGYRLGFGTGDQPFVFIENQNGFGCSVAGAGPTVSGCTAVAMSVSGIGSTVVLKAALNGGYGTFTTNVAGHALNGIVNCYPIWHDGAGAPSWFGSYGMAVFDREFSEAELRAITLQPWALYTTPRSPVFYSLGAGGDQTISLSDSGTGSDGLSLSVALSLTEVAAAVEQLGIGVVFGVGDGGTGADGFGGGLGAQVPLADTGSGSDALSAAVQFVVTDAGSGAELVSLITDIIKSLTDAGVGTDSLGISVTAAVNDAGTAADGVVINVTLPVLADAGAGTDSISVLQSVLIAVADAAQGLDSVGAVSVQLTLAESGTGIDVPGIQALLQVLEQASGMDVVLISNPSAPRIARILFTPRARRVQFTQRGRAVQFSLSQRAIKFTLH